MTRRRTKPLLKWAKVTTIQHRLVAETADRVLLVIVTDVDDMLGAIALEAPRTTDGTALQVAEQIFADHGHKVIGMFHKVPRAKAAAERYARKWLKQRAAIAPCGCDDIVISGEVPPINGPRAAA